MFALYEDTSLSSIYDVSGNKIIDASISGLYEGGTRLYSRPSMAFYDATEYIAGGIIGVIQHNKGTSSICYYNMGGVLIKKFTNPFFIYETSYGPIAGEENIFYSYTPYTEEGGAQDALCGLMSVSGVKVTEAIYLDISVISGGKFFAKNQDRKYGVLSTDGTVLTPFEYDGMSTPRESAIAVRNGEKWGVINYSGDVLLPFRYEYLSSAGEDNGIFVYQESGSCGYIMSDGTKLTEPLYGTVYTPQEGKLLVGSTEKLELEGDFGDVITVSTKCVFLQILDSQVVTFANRGNGHQPRIQWGKNG